MAEPRWVACHRDGFVNFVRDRSFVLKALPWEAVSEAAYNVDGKLSDRKSRGWVLQRMSNICLQNLYWNGERRNMLAQENSHTSQCCIDWILPERFHVPALLFFFLPDVTVCRNSDRDVVPQNMRGGRVPNVVDPETSKPCAPDLSNTSGAPTSIDPMLSHGR